VAGNPEGAQVYQRAKPPALHLLSRLLYKGPRRLAGDGVLSGIGLRPPRGAQEGAG